MKRIFILSITCLIYCSNLSWAGPTNETLYFSGGNNGHAIALDPSNNKLYYGINAGANLRIYDLDISGNPIAYLDLNQGDSTRSLALDAYKQRLYLATSDAGNEGVLRVYPLDSIGNTSGASIGYDHYAGDGYCLAVNPIDNQLYMALDGGPNNLVVYQLDSNGDPTTHSPYPSGGAIQAIALDIEKRKLYAGGSGEILDYTLDASGLPNGGYSSVTAGSSVIETIAIDTYRGKLHCSSSSETNIYTLNLDTNGALTGVSSTEPVGGTVYSLYLDASKNRLYVGKAGTLDWYNLDSNGDISDGPNSIPSGSQVRSIIVDNERKRVYTASSTNSYYYHLSDPAELSLDINFSTGSTTEEQIFMHWRVPNAQYVLVENSPDVQSFSFPNTQSATGIFDNWIAAGGQLWANEETVRARTLTITANVTTGSTGFKNLVVWFWEGSGASNATSVMRRAFSSIEYNGSGTTTTPTYTVTDTPVGTPTFTITPSPSTSPTYTYTPTISPSPTVSPTPAESATITVSPTDTPFLTQTPSSTITITSTISATYTVTSTVTMTPTITLTTPPTHTPTPGRIFYLSHNRFNPNKDNLQLHLELQAHETARVTIYTLKGRAVKQFDESGGLGKIVDLIWDGKNEQGEQVASGLYYIMLKTNQRQEIKKVLVIQ